MSTLPEAFQGPFIELQSFCTTLHGDSERDIEKLIQGFEGVSNAFNVSGNSGANFRFPEDLIAYIEPVDALRTIESVIPDPFREPYMQSLKSGGPDFTPVLQTVLDSELVLAAAFTHVDDVLNTELSKELELNYDQEAALVAGDTAGIFF
jgi:hypothetical protein